jgi:hypothetical protein
MIADSFELINSNFLCRIYGANFISVSSNDEH